MKNMFGIAVKCIVFFNDQILLLTKTNDEMNGDASENHWDLPGGRVKYGESIEDAVRRELKEETGLLPKNILLKATSTVIRPDGLHLLIILHKCVCYDNKVILSNEHNFGIWKNLFQIIDDDSIPTWIKDAIKIAK